MSNHVVVRRKVTGVQACAHGAQWVITPEKGRIRIASQNGIKVGTSTSTRWCAECGAFYTGDVWMMPAQSV
jgi:hypothetical protein